MLTPPLTRPVLPVAPSRAGRAPRAPCDGGPLSGSWLFSAKGACIWTCGKTRGTVAVLLRCGSEACAARLGTQSRERNAGSCRCPAFATLFKACSTQKSLPHPHGQQRVATQHRFLHNHKRLHKRLHVRKDSLEGFTFTNRPLSATQAHASTRCSGNSKHGFNFKDSCTQE